MYMGNVLHQYIRLVTSLDYLLLYIVCDLISISNDVKPSVLLYRVDIINNASIYTTTDKTMR